MFFLEYECSTDTDLKMLSYTTGVSGLLMAYDASMRSELHSAVGQMRTGISSSAPIVITLPAQAKLEVIKFESLELC